MWTTDKEEGYAVIPVREGLLIPADANLSYSQSFDTYGYEGCHMAMMGIVKKKPRLSLPGVIQILQSK